MREPWRLVLNSLLVVEILRLMPFPMPDCDLESQWDLVFFVDGIIFSSRSSLCLWLPGLNVSRSVLSSLGLTSGSSFSYLCERWPKITSCSLSTLAPSIASAKWTPKSALKVVISASEKNTPSPPFWMMSACSLLTVSCSPPKPSLLLSSSAALCFSLLASESCAYSDVILACRTSFSFFYSLNSRRWASSLLTVDCRESILVRKSEFCAAKLRF